MHRPLRLLADCPQLGPLVSRLGIHPLATGVRGRMGDVVFKRCHGKIIVTRVPCLSHHVPTTGQRACRARMREAMAYARRVAADPAAAALYRAAADHLRRPAFRLAVSDFLSQRTASAKERMRLCAAITGQSAQFVPAESIRRPIHAAGPRGQSSGTLSPRRWATPGSPRGCITPGDVAHGRFQKVFRKYDVVAMTMGRPEGVTRTNLHCAPMAVFRRSSAPARGGPGRRRTRVRACKGGW